jgi:hypothetical protein
MGTGALSPEVKLPRLRNGWSYTSTPTIRLHGVVLMPVKGQIYLYLYDNTRMYPKVSGLSR